MFRNHIADKRSNALGFSTMSRPIVAQVYAPNIVATGGHEGFVRRLAMHLAKSGFYVVAVHRGRDLRLDDVVVLGVRSICVSPRICMALDLRKMVTAIRIADLVHVHSPSNPFAFLALVLAKIFGKPTVSTILCYLADAMHHRIVMRLLSPLTALLQTLAALLSDAIHVENLRDYIMLRWVKKLGKILVLAEPIIDVDQVKHECGKSSSSKLILYIGRIDYAKGAHLLIKAAKYLPRDVRIIIAGAIQDRRYLVKLFELRKKLGLEDRVLIVGPINENIKHRLLKMCNVVAIPSLSDIVEAYSIAATEAWIHGKPVVAFPVGALRYRVIDGVNGFLAKKCRDPKALAEAIMNSMKLGNVPKYVPRFDSKKVLIALYRVVLTKSLRGSR